MVQRFSLTNDKQKPVKPFFYSAQMIHKLKQVDKTFSDRDWTEDYEPRVLLLEVMNTIRGIYTIE